MDDATPTDDWAAVLQERFLSDLARVEASEQLTPGERACLQEVMELQPREVHRLMIAAQGGPAADLAGFFIVLQANNKALSVFMFLPVAGLEKFANAPALRAALEQRLAAPALREDILRFVPIEVRESLTLGHPLNTCYRCRTIEELRRKFVSDPVLRSDVILMNADSVALLITWLGYFKPQAGLTM